MTQTGFQDASRGIFVSLKINDDHISPSSSCNNEITSINVHCSGTLRFVEVDLINFMYSIIFRLTSC
jgi:hypothetical protein